MKPARARAPAPPTRPAPSHFVVRIEPAFDAWRDAARRLLHAGIAPEAVTWRDAADAQGELLEDAGGTGMVTHEDGTRAMLMSGGDPRAGAPLDAPATAFRVSRRFVALATMAACHVDARRWSVLYRVLWRLVHGEPRLLDVAVDDDVHRLLRMERMVRHEVHKVHAFVRFRRVLVPDAPDGEHWVAWFAPVHDCLALAAPFFARRFPNMRWSILGPRRSAHWDGATIALGAGVPREAAPPPDALEAMWRTYYASIFNPARTRPRAMLAEMPKRYWHALPEAAIVPGLIADAPARVRRMLEAEARPPRPKRR
jgi:probable DNA metabolism protein